MKISAGDLDMTFNVLKNPKIKKPKEPEFQKECAYCSYWTGVGQRAFKCYCGSCPAKFRDEAKKRKAKEEKKRRRR